MADSKFIRVIENHANKNEHLINVDNIVWAKDAGTVITDFKLSTGEIISARCSYSKLLTVIAPNQQPI